MTLTLLICLLGALNTTAPVDHAPFTAILATHVEDGLVDYRGLKSNRAALDAYIHQLGAVSKETYDAWPEADRLAFLINLYNAETLQLIVDHYPVDSIKDIGSFFRGPWSLEEVTLFGTPITLDHLEHQIIRKHFDEPRIHFAVVCAAMGCPPLRDEAYRGADLDAQLEDQTRRFLEDREKNRVDPATERLYLSPIFKWYGKDFEAATGSVAAYVAPYLSRDPSVAGYRIRYTDYDWSLNSTP